MTLKAQDVLFLLKIAAHPEARWSFAQIAKELGLSASEAHAAAKRALASELLVRGRDPRVLRVHRRNLLEFVNHGLRYVFPAERGEMTRGIPTAHSAPAFEDYFDETDEPPLVWPEKNGGTRGQTLQPIYKSAPFAAVRDPETYELLTLIDAIRAGRARDRKIAGELLAHRLATS